ncbi:hypothetical protein AYK21_02930 [Thermoplasmatales archaeon SG8-52-2]|nr:MAG: hypothetical protein AYK21_02930 [Thermoplasmatales archaeon SG8-52-2]
MLIFLFTIINPSVAIDSPIKPILIGNTLYVGGTGPNNYTKIQDAIENASNGDTVYVLNGIYIENIVVDKSIQLNGEDKNSTVIDGNSNDFVITIRKDWVNISGFTIQNSGNEFDNAGINIYSDYNTIHNNNIILNEENGLHVLNSNFNIISNNEIINIIGRGIKLSSSNNNTIKDNIISSPNFTGIELINSGDNKILNNIILNNQWGIVIVESYFNNNNTIKYNVISKNKYGICIVNSRNNNIEFNNIYYNFIGIELHIAFKIFIRKNNFFLNNRQIYLFSGSDCIFDLNYWNRPRILPKMIWNYLSFGPKFDWHPAKEPYDIEV